MIPDRIASLSLVSTAARIVNTVVRFGANARLKSVDADRSKGYFENLRNRTNML